MKRIYLRGPMSGLPGNNFPAFHKEASRLRDLGFEVVNPAEKNVSDNATWHECLRKDIRAMMDCDTLALLTGWENSAGAHLETHIAHRVGIRVIAAKEILSNR